MPQTPSRSWRPLARQAVSRQGWLSSRLLEWNGAGRRGARGVAWRWCAGRCTPAQHALAAACRADSPAAAPAQPVLRCSAASMSRRAACYLLRLCRLASSPGSCPLSREIIGSPPRPTRTVPTVGTRWQAKQPAVHLSARPAAWCLRPCCAGLPPRAALRPAHPLASCPPASRPHAPCGHSALVLTRLRVWLPCSVPPAGMKALIRVMPANVPKKESAIPGAASSGSSSLGAAWRPMAAATALALLVLAAVGL